jgi:hypothetical protein
MKEAIAIALENNPGIAARRLDRRGGGGRARAQAIFDPTLAGGVDTAKSIAGTRMAFPAFRRASSTRVRRTRTS